MSMKLVYDACFQWYNRGSLFVLAPYGTPLEFLGKLYLKLVKGEVLECERG